MEYTIRFNDKHLYQLRHFSGFPPSFRNIHLFLFITIIITRDS